MAAGDSITGNQQFEYDEYVLGSSTTGTRIERIEGLDDLPDLRTFDKERSLRHGLFPGMDLASKRAVILEGTVYGATATAFRSNLEALADATVVRDEELPLVAQITGHAFTKLRLNARPRKRSLPLEHNDFHAKIARFALMFEATDPRIYDNTESSASTGVVVSDGGLSFPLTFPLDFGGTGTSGTVEIENTGNFAAPWQATISGPVTNPRIENQDTGQIIEVTLSVADGDTLVLDSDLRLVLLNGTASRYSSLTAASEWWSLPPGTTDVRFSGTTGGSPTVLFTWRSARI